MKKNAITILKILLSIVAAFLLQRTFIIELIMRFAPSISSSIPLYLICLLIESIFIYFAVTLAFNKELGKFGLYSLWGCYFAILIFILFFRFTQIKGINLNPLSIISDLKNDSTFFITMILNIAIFIPLGCLLKNIKLVKTIIIGLLIFLSVETIQYVLSIGIFDINDIALNMIGLLIGYKTSKKFVK